MDHSHHLEPSPNHSDDTGSQIEHHEHHSSMGHAGHDHGAMIKDFKKRFYIVLIITIPIMLLSLMIQHWLNVHWEFIGSNILLSLLGCNLQHRYCLCASLSSFRNEVTWTPWFRGSA